MDSTLIDFVMRSDSLTQKGGDNGQIAEYASRLSDRGYDISVEPFRPGMKLRAGSIVHVVNIDRPYDYLEIMALAKGHKVVVSPIHHDLSSVRAMRHDNTGEGIRSHFRRSLPEGLVEFLAYNVRNVRSTTQFDVKNLSLFGAALRALGRNLNVWKHVGRQLDAAAAVALLGNREADALKKDARWSGRNGHLVPNGIPERGDNAGKQWVDRKIPILCVGRIEPRKRQAEIAEAAAKHGIPVLFVGQPSDPGSEYTKRFTSALATSHILTWFGVVQHREILAMYGQSRVLLNASWVEVQSLVDIEAASAGCFVVTTGSGSSKEWMGDAVTEVGARDVTSAVLTAQRLSQRTEGPGPSRYDRTWDSAVDELEELYKMCAPKDCRDAFNE